MISNSTAISAMDNLRLEIGTLRSLLTWLTRYVSGA
ncbi:hypothetical protein VT91_33110 [Clostridium sporogenes]|nr:hypothetical protein WG71_33660 [Clostridium sporogenes]KRU25803.1 hypothetical protein VT91_33110 [Clostridium sporogenes]KRU27916.1 hypothetical protein VT28_24160 [Clostridium sporogenes]KRU42885.1 hypothetical protein VT95_19090 [Clostridium sporogenes]OQP97574.1 hypothetical protein VT92_0216000 [Clostridium sporogenes]